MSFKAGAHQLNLTNSIGGADAVKTKKGGNSDSQQLLLIHYFFASRSQENTAFRLTTTGVAVSDLECAKSAERFTIIVLTGVPA